MHPRLVIVQLPLLALALTTCSGDGAPANPCEGLAPPVRPGVAFVVRGGDAGVQSFGPYPYTMRCVIALNLEGIRCENVLQGPGGTTPFVQLIFLMRGRLVPKRIPDGTVYRQGVELDVSRANFDAEPEVRFHTATDARGQGNVRIRVESSLAPANPQRDESRLAVHLSGQVCNVPLQRSTATIAGAFDFTTVTEGSR